MTIDCKKDRQQPLDQAASRYTTFFVDFPLFLVMVNADTCLHPLLVYLTAR